jgi:hypothetical protein
MLTLSIAIGVLSLGLGVRAFRVPRQANSVIVDQPDISMQTGYCTDGKWVYPGGTLLTVTLDEEAPALQGDVVQVLQDAGWRPLLNRGITYYMPQLPGRSMHQLWPNINLEPDATPYKLSGQNVTRIRHRYRLFVCPPMVFLSH